MRHDYRPRCIALTFTFLFIISCDSSPRSLPNASSELSDQPVNGRVLRWRRTIPNYHPPVPPPQPGTLTPDAITQDTDPLIDPRRLQAKVEEESGKTIEQFAEAIRPIVLKDGQEYIVDVDLELARRIRAEEGIGRVGASSSPGVIPQGAAQFGRSIFGNDDRQAQTHTAFPHNRQIMLTTTCIPYQAGCVSKCSATMIGPHTAIAAAHCFFDPPSQQWRSFLTGAAGAAPFNYPYGSIACGAIWIPSAWFSDTSGTSYWDFAAWDFAGCSDNPGNQVGFLGYWWGYTPLPSDPVWVTGYPGTSAFCGNWPTVCGMMGAAAVHQTVYLTSVNIDVSGGQSGTGWYFVGWDHWIVGNHSGALGAMNEMGIGPSIARRFDGTVYSVFHQVDSVRFP